MRSCPSCTVILSRTTSYFTKLEHTYIVSVADVQQNSESTTCCYRNLQRFESSSFVRKGQKMKGNAEKSGRVSQPSTQQGQIDYYYGFLFCLLHTPIYFFRLFYDNLLTSLPTDVFSSLSRCQYLFVKFELLQVIFFQHFSI